MTRRTSHLCIAASLLCAVSVASAEYATFMFIENATGANDMTPDGSIVVGTHFNGGSYTWTLQDGMTLIPGGGAVALSDDAQTLFGNITNELGQQEAAVWTEENGWVGVGGLDGPCGSLSSAYEMSGDGTAAVGLGWLGCSGAGFLWTEADGMIALEHLHSGNNRASVIAGDGSIIGGFAQGNFNRTPAIWFPDGTGQLLDPIGNVVGEVHGLSDDGSIILGEWDGDAFYITDDEGLVTFPTVIGTWTGIAMDIADDGTIVGFDTFGQNRIAWIRPAGKPAQTLTSYLNGLGAEGVPSGLQVAQAISTNGRFIIGHGFPDPAWIAIIHPDEDIDGDGYVGISDLLALLAAWGECAPDCMPDFNNDGFVDIVDLLQLLAAWD